MLIVTDDARIAGLREILFLCNQGLRYSKLDRHRCQSMRNDLRSVNVSCSSIWSLICGPKSHPPATIPFPSNATSSPSPSLYIKK